MTPPPSTPLLDLRQLLWHLRRGGPAQARTYLRRRRLAGDTLVVTPGGRHGTARHDASAPVGFRAGTTPADTPAGYALDFLPLAPAQRPGMFADLSVATVLDDFSAMAWGAEFTTVPVTPQDWREQLERQPVDLLLVESAWAGTGGAWRYQLTGSKAPSAALQELVAWCREQGVPTVFWNKEDPPHFQDFLDTARLFDAVFTTDSRLVPTYRQELGHDRVEALAFAAQPAVHHPVRAAQGFHERDVAFAGMYFAHKFPERREQMDLLLGAADRVSGKMATGLEIFSRFLGGDERYQFPAPLDRRVVGSLPYDRMLTAYRAFRVFLNVNSVTESPSMCARRVFEITASGTPVVTTRSEAVPRFFPQDEVPVADTAQEAQSLVRALVRSPELNDRMVHRAQRRIWDHHTYDHRAVQVLEAGGIRADAGGSALRDRLCLPTASALISTNRPKQLRHVLSTVGAFRDVELEVLLLTHGFRPDPEQVRALAEEAGIEHLRTVHEEADVPLGACLNRLVGLAEGQVLTKVDDDDLYGPDYLADLLRIRRVTGADVVGKQAHYMHLQEMDATLLRFREREHRWTDLVMGPTLTASAQTFREHPFPALSRGEDSAFLRAVADDGGRIYSADRFNFCQVRRGGAGRHSWAVSEEELLATGDLEYYGMNTHHIML